MPFIRGAAGALRLPQGFGQGVGECVLRAVRIAELRAKPTVQFADARRAVDGRLLAHGNVQSHVKERILGAARRGFEGEGGIRIFEQRLVFRVQGDDFRDQRFERRQGLSCAMLAPGVGVGEAQLVAAIAFDGRHASAPLLRRYSHRSAILQRGQSGLRAVHT